MSAAIRWNLVSVEDYLAGELTSPTKHEYLGGVVYAMAGARNLHNCIATNTLGAIGVRLRGTSCQPYNSDTKIRILDHGQTRFYYPDALVICNSNSDEDSFQDEPVVIAEVLSNATRRIDEVEKKNSYLTIPSLSVYLLIEQDAPVVTVFRRAEHGFDREVFVGFDAIIPLTEIETELPLAEIYDGVVFTPEPSDEDA